MNDRQSLVVQVILLYNGYKEQAFNAGYKSLDSWVVRPKKLSDLPRMPDDFMICQEITYRCYRPFNPNGDPQPSFRDIRKIIHCYKVISKNKTDERSPELFSLVWQCMEDPVSFCGQMGCQPFEDHSDAVEDIVIKESQKNYWDSKP